MYLYELAKNYCELRALAPDTVRTYLACARAVGNPHLQDMTTQWLNNLCATLPSAVTWNIKLARFRTLVRFAIELGYPGADHPVFKVQRKARLMHSRKTLPDQYMLAHEHVKDWNAKTYQPSWLWSMLLDFLYFTGVRRRQVCEIVWSDLDLRRGTLILRAAGAKNKSERTVPIHPELCARLVQYRAVVRTICEVSHDQPLFSWRCIHPDALDEAITPYRVSQFFHLLKRRTNIQVSAHKYRHNFATTLARKVKNIKTVQFLLNHDRVETTMGYVHPNLNDMLEVMDAPSRVSAIFISKKVDCPLTWDSISV